MIGGILGPLRVEHVNGRDWLVLESFRYYLAWPPRANGEYVDVAAGFVTDFGSVPALVPPLLVNRTGKCGKAFVVHDRLYQAPVVRCADRVRIIGRGEADAIMKAAARASNAPGYEIALAWSGVRAGGWVPWNRYRREDRQGVTL